MGDLMNHARRANWTVMMLAALVAGVAAQTARPTDDQARPLRNGGRSITLRGCLTSWAGAPAPGPEGDATGLQRYVLTGVDHGAGAVSPSAVGTSGGGTPSAAPRVAHDSYVVQAKNTLMLGQYLNRQVEIAGMLEVVPLHDASLDDPLGRLRPKAAGKPLSTAPPPPGAPATPETTEAAPVQLQRVTVTSARIIAAQCER
jgi:hypothetical protein